MTTAQRDFITIQKRLSEQRSEFNGLRGIETRSAEQDTRLTALDSELTESETAFRTAADALLTEQATATAPGGEDTEARERRELCVRANVGDVYNSILEKRGATDGATAEAQAAHGCAPNQIPLAMLAAPTEVRAVTPTPGASATEQAETVQPVFATGAGAFLGIDRPSVAMGQVFPVLTSRPAVGGPTALSTDAPDTTGAFDASILSPLRIQASFIYRRTDAMQFSNMDSALRMALNGGLQEKLDWMYDVSLSGPTGTHTRVVPADGVLHVRYLPDNRTPWRGVAPWKRAPSLSKLTAEVEAALIREVRLPTKIIIPMPQGGGIDTDTLRSQFQNQDFQVAFPTTTAAGFGAGRASSPLSDWKVTRLKSEPEEALVGLCKDVPGQIGVLYGIPNVLTSGSGSETQTREAFRRFVLTAIEPLALIVSRELTRVFEVPVELDLSELAHADIAGRARAFKALVGSGMPPSDAAEFVKIEV